MANNSNLSKRAALRQQQELEERRKRTSRMIGIGLGVLALVVVAVLVIVLTQLANRSSVAQQTPPNATEGSGIQITSQGTQPAEGVPNVVVYEDYQCPVCKTYEDAYGPAFMQLVDEGRITFEVRTAYFLNRVNTQSNTNSSERAALAAAAADGVGKYREYHAAVFAAQPAEGVGFTEEQLRVEFPAQAGITGEELTKFQELYDTKAYQKFAENAYRAMSDNGISGTPTYTINGNQLEFTTSDGQPIPAGDAEALMTAIEALASS